MAKTPLFVTAFVLLLFLGLAAFQFSGAQPRPAASVSPVVVELFTSEGCSSCPPADKLLEALEREKTLDGIPVIVLGEHVDYWDGLGWKDRFSSRIFTDRQRDYVRAFHTDSAYTPQMVVDGRYELIGNDQDALRENVHRAAGSSKTGAVQLTWSTPSKLSIDVSHISEPKATVVLAITESALSTTVDAGENGGRVLHHAGVVRVFKALGTTQDGRFSQSTSLTLDPAWDKTKTKAIVLVQKEMGGPVLAAAATSIQ